ncbi:hypothetical protein [Desulfamplus magnetovallimortis]|nr:hypothetical protein [Desulfamplus magnetovallimortis]
MIEAQIEQRIRSIKKRVEGWAEVSLVKDALKNPHDTRLINNLNSAFLEIVKSDAILQTFNLLDCSAACVASSIPERIGLKEMQEVVSKKSDFIKAMNGESNIMGAFMAISSGRPVLSIAVPVFIDGKVKGVLRPIVDIAWFNSEMLEPLTADSRCKAIVYHPELNLDVYKGHNFTLVIKKGYIKPDIPYLPEMSQSISGIIRYKKTDNNSIIAAYKWVEEPKWLIVVEQSMSDVLRPIIDIKYSAIKIAILLFIMSIFAASAAIRPILADIHNCIDMARYIQKGDMDKRVILSCKGDIGELAKSLNDMADGIKERDATIKASELRYKAIFDSAVEGIFQTKKMGSLSLQTLHLQIFLGYHLYKNFSL